MYRRVASASGTVLRVPGGAGERLDRPVLELWGREPVPGRGARDRERERGRRVELLEAVERGARLVHGQAPDPDRVGPGRDREQPSFFLGRHDHLEVLLLEGVIEAELPVQQVVKTPVELADQLIEAGR